MAIKVVWDNPQHTIVRYIYDEKWTWDEFFQAREEAVALIDTVDYKVGVIMDAPPNVQLPPNILMHAKNVLQGRHENTVIVAFVATRPFLRAMFKALVQITRGRESTIVLCANVDEAREVIRDRLQADRDTTLTKRYRDLTHRR
jgi:hypothetical protein